jgi:hypothetical protein
MKNSTIYKDSGIFNLIINIILDCKEWFRTELDTAVPSQVTLDPLAFWIPAISRRYKAGIDEAASRHQEWSEKRLVHRFSAPMAVEIPPINPRIKAVAPAMGSSMRLRILCWNCL